MNKCSDGLNFGNKTQAIGLKWNIDTPYLLAFPLRKETPTKDKFKYISKKLNLASDLSQQIIFFSIVKLNQLEKH